MLPKNRDSLSTWIFPQVRMAVLCRLMLDSREWHVRDLARTVGLSHTAVGDELRAMAVAGVALSRRSGNRVYYSANPACPIFNELKLIATKTAGLADVLRVALVPIAEQVDAAYVFGSMASGSARGHSDIDLMVVGGVTLMAVTNALGGAEEIIGREINATVFGLDEYRAGLAKGHGFIHNVHHGPLIKIIGDPGEFE